MNKLRIEWYYKRPNSKKTYWLKSELMSVNEALQLEEDMIRTGRTSTIEFYDEKDEHWTKKEVIAYLKAMETEPNHVVAFIDGGFDRSTGDAGLGIAIYYHQNRQRWRYRVNERIEAITNNNEAEFAALAYLLTICEQLGVHHQSLTIKTDSKTLYHQATGEWPCYEEELKNWLHRVDHAVQRLGLEMNYELIRREQNKEVDRLASQALESIFIEGKIEKTKNE